MYMQTQMVQNKATSIWAEGVWFLLPPASGELHLSLALGVCAGRWILYSLHMHVQEGEKDWRGGLCEILTDWILSSEPLVNKTKQWANLMQATRASRQAPQREGERGCSFSESLGAVFTSQERPVPAVSSIFSIPYCLVCWQYLDLEYEGIGNTFRKCCWSHCVF